MFFSKSIVYEASASVEQLHGELEAIAERTKAAQKDVLCCLKLSERFRGYVVLSVILGVICSTVIYYVAIPVFGLLSLGLLFSSFCMEIKYYRAKRVNIPSVRYKLAQRLIHLLERDIDERVPLNIRLCYSETTADENKVNSYLYSHSSRVKANDYSLEWLRLDGQFLDETQFSMRLSERAVVRYRYKSKGRIKRKLKRRGVDAILTLSFSRKKYGAIRVLTEDIMDAIALPPDAVLKRIKVSDSQLLLHVRVGAKSPVLRHLESPKGFYQLFTQLLLSAYQVLNLSKTLSKHSAAAIASKAV